MIQSSLFPVEEPEPKVEGPRRVLKPSKNPGLRYGSTSGVGQVFFDLETRSHEDLKLVGGRVYATHPSTEILCAVFLRDHEIRIWVPVWEHSLDVRDLVPDEGVLDLDEYQISVHQDEDPGFLKDWLSSSSFVGHNASEFDRYVWEARFPDHSPLCWEDTIPFCRRAGLPASLDEVGRVIWGQGKDSGKSTMKRLSKPSKKTGTFPALSRRSVSTLTAYCVQDVLLLTRLVREELGEVWKTTDDLVLRADAEINERGALLDAELAQAIVDMETSLRDRRGEGLKEATGGVLTRKALRSQPQFRRWLLEHGVDVPNVQRDTLETVLEEESLDPLVRDAIYGRLGETRITSAKLQRALVALDPDHRMRHILRYHAAHTARWGGRRFQPQNLPRGVLGPEDLARMIDVCLTGDADAFEAALPSGTNISSALGSLIRPCVRAPEGKTLGCADYAAIEARGLYWIARFEEGLDDFRADLDPYKAFASRALKKPYEEISKSERKLFKPAVLGAGYQIGGAKLEAYASGMGVDLRSLGWSGQQLVDVWRDLHPTIAGSRTGDSISGIPIRTGGLWKEFQEAALQVADSGGTVEVGRCVLSSRRGHLVCRLPSSREIIYRDARVDAIVPAWGGRARDTVTFGKVLGAKVIRASQHGGKWIENVVQAVCRDLFAEALVRITDRFGDRAEIVLHVHDEIVWEQEPDESLFEEVVEAMVEVPAWAEGFPIKAEGFLHPRFVKDPPAGAPEVTRTA